MSIQKANAAVLALLESKREFCLGCEKVAIRNKDKTTANLFKYQAKMCQELIDIIELWKEGDVIEIPKNSEKLHIDKVEHKIIEQKCDDKELMNPSCAGELGVWNK